MKERLKRILGVVGWLGTQFVFGFLGIKAETAITTGVACAKHAAVCKSVAVIAGSFSIAVSPIVLIAVGAAALIILQNVREHIGSKERGETAGGLGAAAFEGMRGDHRWSFEF
jgi:hypothetical protein